MQTTIQNLYGLMPPQALPKSFTVSLKVDEEIYHKTKRANTGTEWAETPFKIHGKDLDGNSVRLEFVHIKLENGKMTIFDLDGNSVRLEFVHRENRVWLNGQELHPAESLKMQNHSPDGFNWGYGGSGPAQTALAICVELYGKALASRIYQDFKFRFVADWQIDSSMHEVEISLEAFNRETVIPAMEKLKIELQNELDCAKADLEFLEWLPSNAENVEQGQDNGAFDGMTNFNYNGQE